MSAAVNFPTTKRVTTIDMLNCKWLNEDLDDRMGVLNKDLKVFNFCMLPANPVDHLQYSIMNRSLITVNREHELNQDFLHSKLKP